MVNSVIQEYMEVQQTTPHKAVGGRSPFYGARNEACSGPAGPKARQLEREGTRCTRRD